MQLCARVCESVKDAALFVSAFRCICFSACCKHLFFPCVFNTNCFCQHASSLPSRLQVKSTPLLCSFLSPSFPPLLTSRSLFPWRQQYCKYRMKNNSYNPSFASYVHRHHLLCMHNFTSFRTSTTGEREAGKYCMYKNTFLTDLECFFSPVISPFFLCFILFYSFFFIIACPFSTSLPLPSSHSSFPQRSLIIRVGRHFKVARWLIEAS